MADERQVSGEGIQIEAQVSPVVHQVGEVGLPAKKLGNTHSREQFPKFASVEDRPIAFLDRDFARGDHCREHASPLRVSVPKTAGASDAIDFDRRKTSGIEPIFEEQFVRFSPWNAARTNKEIERYDG